jgi:hypothetical protein
MTHEQSTQDRVDQPIADLNRQDWITDQSSPIEVLSSLCYELRRPLSLVRGYAELLLFESERISQEQLREFLERIIKTAEEVLELPKDIRKYVNEETKGDAQSLKAKEKRRARYARVRYTPPGDEAGVFDFPLEAVLYELEQTRQKRTDSCTIAGFMEWLSSQTTDVVEVSHKQWGVMVRYAAKLIERGLFTVFCPKCGRHLPASTINEEEWSYFHDALAAGGGRRFLCDRGHELLEIQDWIS